MKVFKISLTSNGNISQMPDSQKIFGALVYLISEKHNKDKATDFVENVFNKTPFLMLSNLYPEGYFPAPVSYVLNKVFLESEESGKSIDKEFYKKINKINYISENSLKSFFKISNSTNVSSLNYLSIGEEQNIKIGVNMNNKEDGSNDNAVYSLPKKYFINSSSQRVSLDKYYFLLAYEDNTDINFDFLKDSLKPGEKLILGPKASQGYNLFEISNLKEDTAINFSNINQYLNMGMLLPDDINFNESVINLFSSERRSYNANNQERKFISFIADGSIITLNNANINSASKSITSPFDEKSIVFGNSFLYPLKLELIYG